MEQRILQSLLKPSAYPEPTVSVRLIQTHVSFIFITDDFVYKIKKPVDFGFLNFSTLDRRRFYCNEEVRLNRRLSPDIYLGVVEVRESPCGAAFHGDGKVIDYAVKMRRLPEERMLNRLLGEGKATDDDIRRIARTIAEFHLDAGRSEEIDRYGSTECIRRNWEENFQQIADFSSLTIRGQDLRIIKEWVENFLVENERLFADRVSRGFIRDCDGDIHTENICLNDQVRIFDCIEFNNRFRYSDTASDIAFLLMDFDFNGRPDFSDIFLAEYAAATEDRDIGRLLDFYKLYRAVVRGKVESFSLRDPNIPAHEKQAAKQRAIRYFRLARGYVLRRKLPPSLIITCGLTGTGKSSMAKELAFELGLEVAGSDETRKRLAAVGPYEHRLDEYNKGIYTETFTDATYGELLRRSEKTLAAGRGIVVDATFRRKGDRLLFRNLAARLKVPFYLILTTCPENVVKERLDERLRRREVSDGRWELFQRQKEEFEPPGSNEGGTILLDTTRPVSDNIALILTTMGLL